MAGIESARFISVERFLRNSIACLCANRTVPPPYIYVADLIENLEEDEEPGLVNLALAHYRFEAPSIS